MVEYYSIVWTYQLLCIHSSAHGHSDGFYLSALMNNAATNICIQVSVWTPTFPSARSTPRHGIAGSNGNSAV